MEFGAPSDPCRRQPESLTHSNQDPPRQRPHLQPPDAVGRHHPYHRLPPCSGQGVHGALGQQSVELLLGKKRLAGLGYFGALDFTGRRGLNQNKLNAPVQPSGYGLPAGANGPGPESSFLHGSEVGHDMKGRKFVQELTRGV